MRKLRINEKYLKEFEKWNDPDEFGMGRISYTLNDLEIDVYTNKACNTSCFRLILHKIVDLVFDNNEVTQNEISNHNYTNLILVGVLDVIED